MRNSLAKCLILPKFKPFKKWKLEMILLFSFLALIIAGSISINLNSARAAINTDKANNTFAYSMADRQLKSLISPFSTASFTPTYVLDSGVMNAPTSQTFKNGDVLQYGFGATGSYGTDFGYPFAPGTLTVGTTTNGAALENSGIVNTADSNISSPGQIDLPSMNYQEKANGQTYYFDDDDLPKNETYLSSTITPGMGTFQYGRTYPYALPTTSPIMMASGSSDAGDASVFGQPIMTHGEQLIFSSLNQYNEYFGAAPDGQYYFTNDNPTSFDYPQAGVAGAGRDTTVSSLTNANGTLQAQFTGSFNWNHLDANKKIVFNQPTSDNHTNTSTNKYVQAFKTDSIPISKSTDFGDTLTESFDKNNGIHIEEDITNESGTDWNQVYFGRAENVNYNNWGGFQYLGNDNGLFTSEELYDNQGNDTNTSIVSEYGLHDNVADSSVHYPNAWLVKQHVFGKGDPYTDELSSQLNMTCGKYGNFSSLADSGMAGHNYAPTDTVTSLDGTDLSSNGSVGYGSVVMKWGPYNIKNGQTVKLAYDQAMFVAGTGAPVLTLNSTSTYNNGQATPVTGELFDKNNSVDTISESIDGGAWQQVTSVNQPTLAGNTWSASIPALSPTTTHTVQFKATKLNVDSDPVTFTIYAQSYLDAKYQDTDGNQLLPSKTLSGYQAVGSTYNLPMTQLNNIAARINGYTLDHVILPDGSQLSATQYFNLKQYTATLSKSGENTITYVYKKNVAVTTYNINVNYINGENISQVITQHMITFNSPSSGSLVYNLDVGSYLKTNPLPAGYTFWKAWQQSQLANAVGQTGNLSISFGTGNTTMQVYISMLSNSDFGLNVPTTIDFGHRLIPQSAPTYLPQSMTGGLNVTSNQTNNWTLTATDISKGMATANNSAQITNDPMGYLNNGTLNNFSSTPVTIATGSGSQNLSSNWLMSPTGKTGDDSDLLASHHQPTAPVLHFPVSSGINDDLLMKKVYSGTINWNLTASVN